MANVVTISKKVAKCPECGAKEVFKDDSRGELVCRKCGLVIEDQLMDFSQEWREFEGSGGGKPSSRTGAPISLSKESQLKLEWVSLIFSNYQQGKGPSSSD
jgi:transcription initiation factor TFIIB